MLLESILVWAKVLVHNFYLCIEVAGEQGTSPALGWELYIWALVLALPVHWGLRSGWWWESGMEFCAFIPAMYLKKAILITNFASFSTQCKLLCRNTLQIN